MPSIHKSKDKMWLIDRKKGLVYLKINIKLAPKLLYRKKSSYFCDL